MRAPIVRTIGQPPNAVPRVSAAPHASSTHAGAWSDEISPLASRRSATTPTTFCASFAPWLIASPPDIAHCPPRTGPRTRIGRATREPPRDAVGDHPGREPEHGRDRQHRDHAEHADGMQPVEAAPVDGRRAALDDRRADETTEQRVARARRQAAAAT